MQEETFDAPPDLIYAVYVDGQKHEEFTGSPATSEPYEGGRFTAWEGYIEGTHEKLVPGRRIVQAWRASDFPPGHPASRLELELEPQAGNPNRTRLRLTHSGVPKRQAKEYEAGWVEYYWEPLREFLRRR